MVKVMESHGISKAQKSTNLVFQKKLKQVLTGFTGIIVKQN